MREFTICRQTGLVFQCQREINANNFVAFSRCYHSDGIKVMRVDRNATRVCVCFFRFDCARLVAE